MSGIRNLGTSGKQPRDMPGLGATNLVEKIVQAGGVQNAVGQVFLLRLGGAG